ncbi:MAG: glycoside hydrolase family 2 protein [Myxococcota bacterium]
MVSLSPGSVALIQNVHARKYKSLNGAFRFIVDPYENGYYDYRREPHKTEGYFANKKANSKSDRIEYDFDRSESLSVPGDWNSQRQELFLYEGTIWYKTDFSVEPTPGTRLFVHVGAANYDAKVWLNGEFVGEHVGGFTPFDFEVTHLVRAGENFLVLKVDNTRQREGVPTSNTDWWNYGGITRDVLLVEVPSAFIIDYALQLQKGSRDQLTGYVKLDGAAAGTPVRVRIAEADIDVRTATDANGVAKVEIRAAVELWSPARPRLYDVEFSCETDVVRDRIGFRSLETRGNEILLNGEPIFLRGISLHEQAPKRDGRVRDRAEAEVLLDWATELGCNFVRLAHYPHDERMARLADERGLLLWAEIPVYWTIAWSNAATLTNAKQQLSELITRDKNRASIIIWSVGNETPRSEARMAFMSELVACARNLDRTRLISAALERYEDAELTQIIDDPLGELLDVLGCNEYLGWYDGLPEKADRVTWRSAFNKPLVISEFGADALAGLHGDALTRWSEEYQESVYEHQLGMLARIPFLRGLTPWILTDFRSPRRPLPGIQDFWNRKGLISSEGEKKRAFFVLQRHYRERAAKHGA